MKRSEYEQRRQALEESFEAEVATLRAAHQIRLRSLEALWRADPEEDAPPQTLAAPSMPPPPRLSLPEMTEALEEVFPRLPEVFDKNDAVRLLGWSPPRASLFRALQTLVFQGRLTVERGSNGRVSNVYRQKVLKAEA
ncbi:MAG TPA: hypothetical protein VF756_29715 [Thermoanaerobaculia bacterium]